MTKSLFSLLLSSLRNVFRGEVIIGRSLLLLLGAHFSHFALQIDKWTNSPSSGSRKGIFVSHDRSLNSFSLALPKKLLEQGNTICMIYNCAMSEKWSTSGSSNNILNKLQTDHSHADFFWGWFTSRRKPGRIQRIWESSASFLKPYEEWKLWLSAYFKDGLLNSWIQIYSWVFNMSGYVFTAATNDSYWSALVGYELAVLISSFVTVTVKSKQEFWGKKSHAADLYSSQNFASDIYSSQRFWRILFLVIG